MGFHQKREGEFSHQLAFLVMMIILLLETNCCRAGPVLAKSNGTYECDGALNECRVADDLELELDFSMDSSIIRILQQGASNGHLSINALNANAAVQQGCISYTTCIANGGKTGCRNLTGCRGQLGHH